MVLETVRPLNLETSSASFLMPLADEAAELILEIEETKADAPLPNPERVLFSLETSSASELMELLAESALDSIVMRSWSTLASATVNPISGGAIRHRFF